MKINPEDFRKIRIKIIRTLYSLGKWKSNHLLIKNLESGCPKHEIKKVKKIIKILIKQEILIAKPTIYGKAVSLNIRKKKEIDEIKKDIF